MRSLTPVEKTAVLVLLGAVVARVASALVYAPHVVWDVAWYVTMGRSLLESGEFIEPATGNFTHHYPPLWPILLAGAQPVSPAPLLVPKILAFVAGLAMVATVGGLTWNLYGRQAGLVAAAVFAAFPALVLYDALGYPESLLVALYALTLWSIVKSLERPPLILVGGLAAGLAYLTKASVGPFFLLAAAGGLAWRLHHRRGAVFRDHWYLAAGAVFALLVGLWTARNVARFGPSGWETQPYATESLVAAFSHSGWLGVLLLKALFTLVLLAAVTLPWWGRLRRPLREILRDEAASALWLAALMPAFIALFFMLAFKFAENRPTWDPDDARYLLVSLVPLLWLALDPRRDPAAKAGAAPGADPAAPPADARDRRGVALAWGVGVLLCLLLAFDLRAESDGKDHVLPMLAAFAVPILAAAAHHGWRSQPPKVQAWNKGERAVALLMEPGPFLLGLVAVLLVVVASFAHWSVLLPAAVAAGGAALARTPHGRAVAFAGIILGASFAGATLSAPWQRVGDFLEGKVEPGENVAMPSKQLHYLAAAAPEGVEVVGLDKGGNATTFIVIPNPPRGTQFRDFQVAAILRLEGTTLPGTELRRALQEAMGVELRPYAGGTAFAVFARVPPADAPAAPPT